MPIGDPSLAESSLEAHLDRHGLPRRAPRKPQELGRAGPRSSGSIGRPRLRPGCPSRPAGGRSLPSRRTAARCSPPGRCRRLGRDLAFRLRGREGRTRLSARRLSTHTPLGAGRAELRLQLRPAGRFEIYRQEADRAEAAELVPTVDAQFKFACGFTPDGTSSGHLRKRPGRDGASGRCRWRETAPRAVLLSANRLGPRPRCLRTDAGLGAISSRGRERSGLTGEYLGFVANSLIFVDIGIYFLRQDFLGTLLPGLSAILIVMLGGR